MRLSILFIFCICFSICSAQERIDGTINFQSDPEKQYSLYIPSTYDASVPNKLMVGLHPFNVSKWNSISWCDTLIVFAETNNLILLCPDGGIDGKIDDPIDTAFTTFMIDSILTAYTIDESEIYAMGFSWGGKTTYTYGLNHINRFRGLMPIGAAVTIGEVNSLGAEAYKVPCYIIHGSSDSPNIRFTPIKDFLIESEACVESNLMSGVGHTIDFPNRNEILTTGFKWLEEVSCTPSANHNTEWKNSGIIFPNPIKRGGELRLDKFYNSIKVYSFTGVLMKQKYNQSSLETAEFLPGWYLVVTEKEGKINKQRILITP